MEKASKSLTSHLERIQDLVFRIEAYGGKAPRIEIDLLLGALRDMYESLVALPTGYETVAETPAAAVDEQLPAEPSVEEISDSAAILLADTDSEPVYADEPESHEEPVEESPVMEDESILNEVLFNEPESEPEPVPEPEPEPEPEQQPSLFDYIKPQEEKPSTRTIADSLGELRMREVGPKINANKVQDLRTIININDKFSFMNELFHNNMKGYNDFILRLNAIDDREEALAYVKSVAEQYKWDEDSLAVKTFYGVFDRKF